MDVKQKERQQRGEAFQQEIRSSWKLVANCWRMRIADGRGSTRPADDIILLKDINVLAELKRTKSERFEFSFLRTNQVKGLLDFEAVVPHNMGLVFVSFHDDTRGLDEAVCFRLLTAMYFMRERGRQYITLDEFKRQVFPCLRLPRKKLDDGPGYDLKEVNSYYAANIRKK